MKISIEMKSQKFKMLNMKRKSYFQSVLKEILTIKINPNISLNNYIHFTILTINNIQIPCENF